MRIAIIGCGNMGTGLAEMLSPFHEILLHDRDWEWTKELAERVNGKAFKTLYEAIEKAQLIFLAIKPQNLKDVAPFLDSPLTHDQIIISLLAGTPLAILRHYFPQPIVIRMMPNLAMRYGAGVIGLVDSPHLAVDLKEKLKEILAPLGLIYWLKEIQIDALTSLTGSGPAFILTLIETMIEAGIAMGFHAKDAQDLILQMMQGCLTLMQNTKMHPAELKWQIASPNGTTIAGLRALEHGNVRSGLLETFLAAYQRAQEIGKNHVITDTKDSNS